MLISNSDYGTFTHGFLDNKLYQNEKNNEFYNISIVAPNEFIFCGFVDFAKGINSNANLNKKLNKKIDDQNNRIMNLEKSLYKIKILFIPIIILLIAIHFINIIPTLSHNNQKNDA